MTHAQPAIITQLEKVLPWLFPALLLFSRALADITVVLTGIFFLYYSYKNKNWCWLKQTWFVLALLFWAYLLLINLPLSVAPGESLKYALTFIRWPLFAAAIAFWLFQSQQRQKQFLLALTVVMLFIVADTVWQYFFHVDWFGIERFNEVRLTGPFRNPVPGTLMLRVWFISLFALQLWQVQSVSPRWRVLSYLSTLMLGIVFMFMTGERMALMLFFAGSVLISLTLFIVYQGQRVMIVTIVAVLCLIASFVFQADTQMSERSVLSIGEKLTDFWTSDYGRVFSAAWQVWQQNPLLGSGIHTYQQVCQQMDLFANSRMQCTHPHNLYLQLGAETGVIGVVLFVTMVFAIYFAALKNLLQRRIWLQAALSFVVLTVSFWPLTGGISVLNNWVGALVWLGVGWVLAVSATPQQEQYQPTADVNRSLLKRENHHDEFQNG